MRHCDDILAADRRGTVQGFGTAIMMALTNSLVGETVPKVMTGRIMGMLGTMSAIGTALGPSLGGILIAALAVDAFASVAGVAVRASQTIPHMKIGLFTAGRLHQLQTSKLAS